MSGTNGCHEPPVTFDFFSFLCSAFGCARSMNDRATVGTLYGALYFYPRTDSHGSRSRSSTYIRAYLISSLARLLILTEYSFFPETYLLLPSLT